MLIYPAKKEFGTITTSEGGGGGAKEITVEAENRTDYAVKSGERVFIYYSQYEDYIEYNISALGDPDNPGLTELGVCLCTGTALEDIESGETGNVSIQDSKFPEVNLTVTSNAEDFWAKVSYFNRLLENDVTVYGDVAKVPTNSYNVEITVSAEGYASNYDVIDIEDSDTTVNIELTPIVPVAIFTAITGYSTNMGNKFYVTDTNDIDWTEATLPSTILGNEFTSATIPFAYANGKLISPCLTGNKYAISDDYMNTWNVEDSPVDGAEVTVFKAFGNRFYCYDRNGNSSNRSIYVSTEDDEWMGYWWDEAGTLPALPGVMNVTYAHGTFFLCSDGSNNYRYTTDFTTYTTGTWNGYTVRKFNVMYKFNKYIYVLYAADYNHLYTASNLASPTEIYNDGYRNARNMFLADTSTAAVCLGPFSSGNYCLCVTTDGDTWSKVALPVTTTYCTGMTCINDKLIITYSDSGVTKTLTTSDLGSTWTEEDSTIPITAINGNVECQCLSIGYTMESD